MDYWGRPWLSNSHSTREEFLKGPEGLSLIVFFLVDSFILQFSKQKFSDNFFYLVFYSHLLKQRQVRNRLKICLVENSTKDSLPFLWAKIRLFLCYSLEYFSINQVFAWISRIIIIVLYKFSLHFLHRLPWAAESIHIHFGSPLNTSTAYVCPQTGDVSKKTISLMCLSKF